jgi:hypothetical protein
LTMIEESNCFLRSVLTNKGWPFYLATNVLLLLFIPFFELLCNYNHFNPLIKW